MKLYGFHRCAGALFFLRSVFSLSLFSNLAWRKIRIFWISKFRWRAKPKQMPKSDTYNKTKQENGSVSGGESKRLHHQNSTTYHPTPG